MNPMLEKLKKLKKNPADLSEAEKEGKIGAVKKFADMAKSAMGDKVKGLKKVTVASNSPEGLEKGLEMAKEAVDGEEAPTMEMEPEMAEAPLDESASAEEIDAEIERLMALKSAKSEESLEG